MIQEPKTLEFRCVEPVQIQFLDDSMATVKAFTYLDRLEKEHPNCTDYEKRAWKFYLVTPKATPKWVSLISELELEKRMGTEAFKLLK